MLMLLIVESCPMIFFFSSRRRHTRFDCDWSSDVCSSDLAGLVAGMGTGSPIPERGDRSGVGVAVTVSDPGAPGVRAGARLPKPNEPDQRSKIGRASCRGRVEISGGGVSLKKKK